ncbi:hypothetical protein HDR60_03675 [bacterium]|nr:hypothetical protein [bacterium]
MTNLSNESKKILKQKDKRLDEYYEYFSTRLNFQINNWNKLSVFEKVNKLLDEFDKIQISLKEELKKANFGNETIKNIMLEKVQDEFAEKVANLDSKEEELTIYSSSGKPTSVTRTTYTDKDGKEYIKDIIHRDDNDDIKLYESNIPFYDYESVQYYTFKDGIKEYKVLSHNFTTDGTSQDGSLISAPLPKGYIVAKDRSEHLSDKEKGKLIVIPEDKSLLPDGVQIIDDGKGGKIVKAPQSAYKKNGNLDLKPDKTLLKTTTIYDIRNYKDDKSSNKVSVYEYVTQKDNTDSYGENTRLSSGNRIYYKYATIDDKTKELHNYETVGGKVIDGIVIDKNTQYINGDGKLITSEEKQEEMFKNKEEILNELGY